MKKAAPDHPTFPFFAPVVTVTGPGTFKVELGKPIYWLTPNQLAAQFNHSPKTIYRWRETIIPREIEIEEGGKKVSRILWRERGVRGWEFSSEVVPFLRGKLRGLRPS